MRGVPLLATPSRLILSLPLVTSFLRFSLLPVLRRRQGVASVRAGRASSLSAMATPDRAGRRPLPKFGEWDVKDPATADGFTVIFQKARDGKKTTTGPGRGQAGIPPAFRDQHGSADDGGYTSGNSHQYDAPPKRAKSKWAFCACGC